MKNKTTRFITTAAVIAALYTVLTLLTNIIPPVGGVFQFRLAEAMCILPMFTPAAIPGLIIGCLLTNIITGAGIYDVVFGTLATAIGAVLTYLICYRKNDIAGGNFTLHAILAPIPAILANALIIPFVIQKLSEVPLAYFPLVISVGFEELVCAGLLGVALAFALRPHTERLFGSK